MNKNLPSKERIIALLIMALIALAMAATLASVSSWIFGISIASSFKLMLPIVVILSTGWWLFDRGYLNILAAHSSKKRDSGIIDTQEEVRLDPIYVKLAEISPPPEVYNEHLSPIEFLKSLDILFVPFALIGICVFYPDPPTSSFLVIVISVLSIPWLVGRELWKLRNHPITCNPLNGQLRFHEEGNRFPWIVFGGPADPFDIDKIPLDTANQNFLEQYVPGFRSSVKLQIPDASSPGGLRKVRIRHAEHLAEIKSWRASLDIALKLKDIELLEQIRDKEN